MDFCTIVKITYSHLIKVIFVQSRVYNEMLDFICLYKKNENLKFQAVQCLQA